MRSLCTLAADPQSNTNICLSLLSCKSQKGYKKIWPPFADLTPIWWSITHVIHVLLILIYLPNGGLTFFHLKWLRMSNRKITI